ncbi:hypothetical protein TNCV_4127011 [Trichonephila clavipes]|uniref:Transposase Tc1-like domain-containing protein n=1 Tax=Trichonephila clavipes TaxID=2585209 RepID=A0A8X6VRM4_TRICX|nr:hypothetical protein TNCV_4127011 [Trichonephila clavipes]
MKCLSCSQVIRNEEHHEKKGRHIRSLHVGDRHPRIGPDNGRLADITQNINFIIFLEPSEEHSQPESTKPTADIHTALTGGAHRFQLFSSRSEGRSLMAWYSRTRSPSDQSALPHRVLEVVSSSLQGLQTLIKEHAPNANSVHCAAHSLNLILNDTTKYIPKVSQFFDYLEKIYTFFGNSTKRWAMLINDSSEKYKTTLKKYALLNGHQEMTPYSVFEKITLIMKTSSKISLISTKKDERDECKNTITILESYDFTVFVTFFFSVIKIIDPISKALQYEKNDLEKASILPNNLLNELVAIRNQNSFSSLLNESEDLDKGWGVTPCFKNERRKRTKRFFDELAEDQRVSDPESSFKVNVDMPLRRFRRQYEQLWQFERGRIVGMMEAEWLVRRVARQLGRSDCVPTASSAAFQAQVAPSLGAPVSSRTIRRRLAEGHLESRRSLRVLPLRPTHRRLNWCRARGNWTAAEWYQVETLVTNPDSISAVMTIVLVCGDPVLNASILPLLYSGTPLSQLDSVEDFVFPKKTARPVSPLPIQFSKLIPIIQSKPLMRSHAPAIPLVPVTDFHAHHHQPRSKTKPILKQDRGLRD